MRLAELGKAGWDKISRKDSDIEAYSSSVRDKSSERSAWGWLGWLIVVGGGRVGVVGGERGVVVGLRRDNHNDLDSFECHRINMTTSSFVRLWTTTI